MTTDLHAPGPLRAPDRRPGSGWLVATVVVGLLAVSNVVVNRFLPGALYVPWNLTMTLVLVVVAVRWDGQSTANLGLGPGFVGRGLRWGGAVAALVVAVELAALALPATGGLFDDRRVHATGVGVVVYQALVRIPLGTVVLEETAFRGVLPAVFGSRLGKARGAVVASALFGLWHVLPAWNIDSVNPVYDEVLSGTLGRVLAVLLAVVGTGVVGMGFWWLRDRSNSLLTPMAVHTAFNSTGYVLAWWAQHS